MGKQAYDKKEKRSNLNNKHAKNFSLYLVIFLTILFVLSVVRLLTPQPMLPVVYTYAELVYDLRRGNIVRAELVRETDVGNAARLRKKNIWVEQQFGDNTICIPTICNTKRDFRRLIKCAL